MVSAAEHFAWAVERAMAYVAEDNAASAMASLVSDLGKHPGTASILTLELEALFVGEILVGGTAGAKRFIEGLPAPAEVRNGG